MSDPTVVLIDDDVSVRKSLTRLIASAGYQVAAFESAQQFLQQHDPAAAGCLVLDVRLPGLGGLDLQQELAARQIWLPIIFITGFGDIPMSVRAIQAGAVDFLPKPVADDVLLAAIERAISQDRAERATREEIGQIQQRLQRLTPREREVMQLVVAGKANKQIASELGMAEKTVKVHRGRVMQKMEASSIAQLVQYATRLGMQ